MVALREKALAELLRREPSRLNPLGVKVSEIFGVNVFDRIKMKQYLSEDAFENVTAAIDEGRRIDRKIADQVAAGMKSWAMERGDRKSVV